MKTISKATINRYPIYLKALRKLEKEGKQNIMSNELAEYVNIRSTTIRSDFSLIGTLGKQGCGYDVKKLIKTFEKCLGVSLNKKIILVGAQRFGEALLNYNSWPNVAGEIVCAFDYHPEYYQDAIIPVYNIVDLKEKTPEDCNIAILCLKKAIPETVEVLKELGIKGIVDFTNEHYNVPKGMKVKNIDVVSTIQELVYEANLSNEENK